MKILIFGGTGQVGYELVKIFNDYNNLKIYNRDKCNFECDKNIIDVLRSEKPEIIINAVAYTNVNKAEIEKKVCYKINNSSVKIIGEQAFKLGSYVIHYSTDYVFNGVSKTSYLENDKTDPINVYGSSKLTGENSLIQSRAKYTILRTSWVMGIFGNNFIKTIILKLIQEKTINVIKDQYGTPTSAKLIAFITEKLVCEYKNKNSRILNNIYHLTATGHTNWYDYTEYIKSIMIRNNYNNLASVNAILSRDYKTLAKRPSYSVLNTNKLRNTLKMNIPHWESIVEETVIEILSKQNYE